MVCMRDLEQVLYEKEWELARVRHEVEALRLVLPLFMEQQEAGEAPIEFPGNEQMQKNRWPLQLG